MASPDSDIVVDAPIGETDRVSTLNIDPLTNITPQTEMEAQMQKHTESESSQAEISARRKCRISEVPQQEFRRPSCVPEVTTKVNDLRRVLRRKRALIMKTVVLTNHKIQEMLQQGILTEQTAAEIKGATFYNLLNPQELVRLGLTDIAYNDNKSIQSEQSVRVAKLVEMTQQVMSKEQLELLLSYLQNTERSLYNELEAELEAETGTMEIGDTLLQEAHMLVHKQLGHIRRFSETDKRLIADMIAQKAQAVANVCKARMVAQEQQLDMFKKYGHQRSKAAGVACKKIDEFQRVSDLRFLDLVSDARSTKQALLEGHENGRDVILRLCEKVDELIHKFWRVLIDHKILMKDKEQSLQQLGVQTVSRRPVNTLLGEYVRRITLEREENARIRRNLHLRVVELEEKLLRQEVIIRDFQAQGASTVDYENQQMAPRSVETAKPSVRMKRVVVVRRRGLPK